MPESQRREMFHFYCWYEAARGATPCPSPSGMTHQRPKSHHTNEALGLWGLCEGTGLGIWFTRRLFVSMKPAHMWQFTLHVSSCCDQLRGDGYRDFFWRDRANIQTYRGMNAIKEFCRYPFLC